MNLAIQVEALGHVRVAVWLALLGLASACGPATGHAPSVVSSRPNVVLVTIDTLRADHVGCYGAANVETPTLDRLAQEGTRFATAIASAPVTLPSHASIFTGLYPPRHGVRHNGLYRLPARIATLPERFREAGYSTAAVVGAAVLARRYGLARGFATYDDAVSGSGAALAGYPERPAAQVTARALAWLASTPEPFFLWLHYYDPHPLFRPPAPYRERFSRQPYDGEVAYVDAALGRLLDALRGSRTLDRSVVVVTSDHGESLGEHLEETHGYTLYDASLAVPLLWRGPGIPAGRVVPGVVRTVDVAPTLLRLASLPVPSGLDGEDLVPLWSSAALRSERSAYAETLATRLDHGWSPLHSIRTSTLHYVRAPRPELYDAEADPPQIRNLLAEPGAQMEERLAPLEAELERILARESAGERLVLDAATRSQLRALGYALPEGTVAYTGLDPKDGLVHLARYYDALRDFTRGELDTARAKLLELLEVAPESSLSLALLARVELVAGRPQSGLGYAEAAAERVPHSSVYRNLVGDAKAHLGDREGAREAYLEASRIDPSEPSAKLGLMGLAARAGALQEAQLWAHEALALDPASPWVHERVGAIWERAGEAERALSAYRNVLALDGSLTPIRRRMVALRERLDRDRNASSGARR